MDARALVTRVVEAWDRHDAAALPPLYAPGAPIRHAGVPEAVPVETWVDTLEAFVIAMPDLRLTIDTLVGGDGTAAAELTVSGTNTGPVTLGDVDRALLRTDATTLPPTGRSVRMTGAVVVEAADGRIVAERHYWPPFEVLTQLGLLASPLAALG